jgi:hypothetical protein
MAQGEAVIQADGNGERLRSISHGHGFGADALVAAVFWECRFFVVEFSVTFEE